MWSVCIHDGDCIVVCFTFDAKLLCTCKTAQLFCLWPLGPSCHIHAIDSMASSSSTDPADAPSSSKTPAWVAWNAARHELTNRDRPTPYASLRLLELAAQTIDEGPRVNTEGATPLQIVSRENNLRSIKAGNVAPTQMMCYVQGRPVVALAITHERTKTSNVSSHLGDMFSPLPLHFLLGRSASMHPKVPPEQCLWWTWKDRHMQGFQYMFKRTAWFV